MTYDPHNIPDDFASEPLNDQARLDTISVLATTAGRRFVYRLITLGGVLAPTFSPDANVAAFREGVRNLALRLLGEAQNIDPENYRLMMIENL